MRALRMAHDAGDVESETRSHCLLADILERQADLAGAGTALHALPGSLAERLGDPALQLMVLLMACRLANWRNDDYDGFGRTRRPYAGALSLRYGDRSHEGTAYNALGVVAMYRFEATQAASCFRQSADVLESLRRPRNVVAARLNEMLLAIRTGRIHEALALGEVAIGMAKRAQATRSFEEASYCALAEAHLRGGAIDLAEGAAQRVLTLAGASHSRNAAPARMKIARCAIARGDGAGAMAQIVEALPLPLRGSRLGDPAGRRPGRLRARRLTA